MDYKHITKGATIISIILWVTAASLWANHGVASFAITGLLAALSQVVAVNSAKREGATEEGRTWLVDDFLDEVGER